MTETRADTLLASDAYPSLPKWPQMRVKGTPVSRERALEIVRRTETFFDPETYGASASSWERFVFEVLGFPTVRGQGVDASDYALHLEAVRAWREAWGHISNEYVIHDMIAPTYVGGAYGFVSLDGTVFASHNIGKWPDVREVETEWGRIARAFPDLDLEVLLMSGEAAEDDIVPLVGFVVRAGTVEVHSGARDWFARFGGWGHPLTGRPRTGADETAAIIAKLKDRLTLSDEERSPISRATILDWAKRYSFARHAVEEVYGRLENRIVRVSS